ncbi:MAG: DUF4123 domain-containing protein [Tepidisphaeraceae bacterium]|jgi:hypothetical protein
MNEPFRLSSNVRLQTVRSMLFGASSGHACAVVDPDFCPQIIAMIEQHRVEHAALLGPHFAPDLLRRSPHLVRLEPFSPFSEWLLSGWGLSWGIYAVSSASMDALREHFRSLLMVLDPSGTLLFFRYYDPRVFGVYLPTVNEQEAGAVFGPVESYVFEEEDTHAILRFVRGKKQMQAERFAVVSGVAAQPAALGTQHSGHTTPESELNTRHHEHA